MSAALSLVVRHPGFFRIEAGSTNDRFPEPARPHFSVGVSLDPGRVSWWHGFTLDEALEKAAAAITAPVHEWNAAQGDYGCDTCGVELAAHRMPWRVREVSK